MAWIPENIKWYFADLIVEIVVDNSLGNCVHQNTVLIRADSPEDAYEKALELGQEENSEYKNPEGITVQSTFRGIKNVCPIYDPLEHGAELYFEEVEDVSEEEIQNMIRSKEKLAIFKPDNQ